MYGIQSANINNYKQKLIPNMTHKICPLREHTATHGKKRYNFCTRWGQIFLFGRPNVLGGFESNYPHYTIFVDVSVVLLLATGMVVCCLLPTGSPLLVPGCRMSCTIIDVAAGSGDD